MIPVNRPVLDGNESKYLADCISSGWISSEGPYVAKFEEQFAEKVERKFAISVANGTAALDIAIEMLDLEHGDEVIMPAFTIISCVNQVIRCGAIPVLIDSDPDTWNMDTKKIEEKISDRTKAILVVHIYGLPVNMNEIEFVAKKYGIKVIEDAAEAHGLKFGDRACGSFGVCSTFSFYPNKLITTGEGGMIVTDDPDLDKRARMLRNLNFTEPRYVHDGIAWNYRMTNLQAAVGVAQIERWDEFLKRKINNGNRYHMLLSNLKELQLHPAKIENAINVYWVFGVLVRNGKSSSEVRRLLQQKGVSSRSFFCPLHLQPGLVKKGLFAGETYPVAEMLWNYGLYLPSGVGITDSEIDFSAAALKTCLGIDTYEGHK